MFWIQTLKKLDKNLNKMFQKIGLDVGTLQGKQENLQKKSIQLEKRINTISNYIQGPLQEVINKAIENYFKELEKIIEKKNSNKKDK